MRTQITLLAALALSVSAAAGEKFAEPRTYGEALKGSPTVTIATMVADADAYAKKAVAIEGTVKEVCQTKGCWMIVNDGTQDIRVNFKGYAFFVPYDSPTKRVRLEGSPYRKLVKKEVLQHWAEEAKNPEAKPEEITEDREMVMFMATGVVLEKGSELSRKQLDVIEGKTESDHK